MGVPENVAAAKHAKELLSIAELDTPEFWRALRTICDEHDPPPVSPESTREKMDDLEAVRFGRTEMPFGEHFGERLGDVPCAYLIWLTENNWQRELLRYMRSDVFASRQDHDKSPA